MTALTQEAHLLHNPALGAVLLWRFTKAYADADAEKLGAPLSLAFVVLPLVWHSATAELIERTLTNSGLRKYAAKFTESEGARDVLLGIHDRILRLRPKTQAALRVALAKGLISVTSDARLQPKLLSNEQGLSRTTLIMADNAEKLGVWCAQLTLHEIKLILHVSL